MGCPLRARVPLAFTTLLMLALGVAACGSNPETVGAAGTAGSEVPITITAANTYITVENRTGAPLTEVEIVIAQLGVRPPFRAAVPRLENGSPRDFSFSQFRAGDGTQFSRSLARPKSIKLTAKDVNGKSWEQEVPFQ